MTNKKKNKEERPVMQTMDVNELFEWCLDQALARRNGTLSLEQIKKLDSQGFKWDYYEGFADGAMAMSEEDKNK